VKALPTLAAILLTAASFAHAQSSSAVNKDGTKPRPDPPQFYTPYTGPGFGNPDANQRKEEPLGTSRRKYHDASGTSAYSRGGNSEATPLAPPPTGKKKKQKPKPEADGAAPVKGEKR
jgi:hypothetical protein